MDAKVTPNTWKLQDAKARLSEVVRLARAGEPQKVTVHGKEAVAVVDLDRFDITPKAAPRERTMAGFIERSQKFAREHGLDFGPEHFDRPLYITFPKRRLFENKRRRGK
jgi:antitoxin Phd